MDFVKYMNFNKNETESKMENATRSFRETCVSAHVKLQIKSKTVVNWSSRQKRGHFLYLLFCPKRLFLRFVFYLNV